jgi:acetyl-CoA synthetase
VEEDQMTELLQGVFAAPADFIDQAHVDAAAYYSMYQRSVEEPEAFWAEQGQRIDWITPFTKVKNTSFAPGKVSIKWYEDGTLNVSANCIDRHLIDRAEQTAIIWEPDDPAAPARHISYRELLEQTCRMANVLKSQGIGRGDRVVIYLPMIPEAAPDHRRFFPAWRPQDPAQGQCRCSTSALPR